MRRIALSAAVILLALVAGGCAESAVHPAVPASRSAGHPLLSASDGAPTLASEGAGLAADAAARHADRPDTVAPAGAQVSASAHVAARANGAARLDRRPATITRRHCADCERADQHLVRRLERGVMTPKDPALAPPVGLLAAASEVDVLDIHGQRAVVVVPKHPNGAAIVFAHGADETANLDIDVPPSAPAITALVRAGYAWAESDAGFNNWGNHASLVDDLALADWLRAHGARRIDIGGDSMGGLDATQLIPFVHPTAVFELFPVYDLHSVWPLFHIDIATAHTDVAALSPVPVQDARGLPMLITASPWDTVVSKATNADVLYRAARAAGAQVTLVSTVGEHDNPSNWSPSRLIAFLNRAAAEHPLAAGPA